MIYFLCKPLNIELTYSVSSGQYLIFLLLFVGRSFLAQNPSSASVPTAFGNSGPNVPTSSTLSSASTATSTHVAFEICLSSSWPIFVLANCYSEISPTTNNMQSHRLLGRVAMLTQSRVFVSRRGLATATKAKEVLPLKGIKVLDMTRVLAGVSLFFL
jgi:hypothetical protein